MVMLGLCSAHHSISKSISNCTFRKFPFYSQKRAVCTRSRKLVVTNLVNVDVFSPSVVLGGVMVGAGCYLYVVRQQNPKISKDFDVIAATMMTVTGGILFLQGWRLDPLLLLSELLLATMVFYFANDALSLRQDIESQKQDEFNIDPRSLKRRNQQQYGYYGDGQQPLLEDRSNQNFQGWMGNSRQQQPSFDQQFYNDQQNYQTAYEEDGYRDQQTLFQQNNRSNYPRSWEQPEEGGVYSPFYQQQNFAPQQRQQQGQDFNNDFYTNNGSNNYPQGYNDENFSSQVYGDQQVDDQQREYGQFNQQNYPQSPSLEVQQKGGVIRPAEFVDVNQKRKVDEQNSSQPPYQVINNEDQDVPNQQQQCEDDQEIPSTNFQDQQQTIQDLPIQGRSRWQVSRDMDLEIDLERRRSQWD
eukprot:TRINITY_DN4069_c0_g1_i2.p2 TRINITY_DN4069_c0_g1~~TRINITY_DN4069_c0_g1_i2.p2  ORF type:complete len:412 (+),score=48.19 TRINITY_DN4069_c0_g1_i2:86-1321(+)